MWIVIVALPTGLVAWGIAAWRRSRRTHAALATSIHEGPPSH